MRWMLSSELSRREQQVAGLLKRSGRFYVFLRTI